MKEPLIVLLLSCILLGASVSAFASGTVFEDNAEAVNGGLLMVDGEIPTKDDRSADDAKGVVVGHGGGQFIDSPPPAMDVADGGGGLHCQDAVICQLVFK